MSLAPFPNNYRSRQVAEADSEPCAICYKPTSTVLLASNKADHFYVCLMHMQDKSFASPIIPDKYRQLLGDKARLETEVRQANKAADDNKPYSWNKLMSNIGWSDPSDTRTNSKSDDHSNSGNAEKSQAEKDKNNTYEELVSHANSLKKKLADVSKLIDVFQFKQYVLAKDVYRMRINNTLQAKHRVIKQKSAEEGLSMDFPSIPKSGFS